MCNFHAEHSGVRLAQHHQLPPLMVHCAQHAPGFVAEETTSPSPLRHS
jgi:hypothetical protein